MGKQDSEEFAVFVQASQAALRRTAFLLCGDWQLASDHVQEGLIRVYVRWGRLERDGRLHSYARKAVVSAAIDARRRRSSTELVTDTSTGDTVRTADHAEAHSERAALLDALAQLPPRQRACVVLRYYEDLPVAEVARALDISEGTVKSQTSRGIATLQSAFVAAGDDGLFVS